MASGAIEPGAIEPGAIEPGAIEPGAIEPGAIEPGAIEPGDLPYLDLIKSDTGASAPQNVAAGADQTVNEGGPRARMCSPNLSARSPRCSRCCNCAARPRMAKDLGGQRT